MSGTIYNHKYKNTPKKWKKWMGKYYYLSNRSSYKQLEINMFTNIKEVELYDLKYEYSSTLKNKTPIHDCCQ